MQQSTFDQQRAALSPALAALAAEEQALAARRQALQAQLEDITKREREARAALILANVDALLALMPEHSCTGCTDSDPHNWWRGECPRCVLLRAKEQRYLDDEMEVELSIRYTGSQD